MEKQNNIPKLRFSEFSDGWEVKKLGEVSDLITKGTTPSKFVSHGVKFIKLECFDENTINADKCLFIEEETHNKELKRSILQENDLLFAIAGATIGKVNFVKKDILPANTNQALSIVRLKKEENRNFIFQILKSKKMQKYIKDSISVGAQPNLNLEQMNNFSFAYPTFSEQQKIATFLSNVDEKLQALKKKKSLLETYKKGVMQKLFSQEICFKDDEGNDFEDWEMKKLGEITREIKRDLKSKRDLSELEVLTISSDKGFISQKERFSQIIAGNSISKYTLLCTGEMSYNKGASKRFKYGCFYTLNLYKEALVPNVYISFSFKKEFLSNFYFYLFSTKYADSQLRQFISSSVRLDGLLNINRDDFFSIKVPIPCLAEQTKIANFLTAIDEKINKVDSQIKQTELWKKGLLQQMFV